ncbi:MAG: hypothetical protein NT025_00130, partial [bacterium]|nr:hypothetical protein [bacterium]
RGPAWTFPQVSLEEAIVIAREMEEKKAGNPMRADELAKAVGFNKVEDWRFQNLLRSANQYGLVKGTGINVTVSMEKIGQDIVAPSSGVQRQKALLDAFRNVPQFAQVHDFYRGKKIPDDEFFRNTVHRDFNVPRDRVEKFAEVFFKNIQFLRAFDASDTAHIEPTTAAESQEAGSVPVVSPRSPHIREYLDSCFVMMPFGGWFDTYYQDVYVPAIKEAGFEPVRADELFSSGGVVEQIWEQIRKAKLLIADLTGKNANVFYELGLAHAARKPVVFITKDVTDVPFDLKHLRVIVFDINAPGWDDKLRSRIVDYLKNAAKDPTKSIPSPFRDKGGESA